MSKPVVVTSSEWNPYAIKFMPPKINKSGGKAISVINTETKRSLHVSTPLMMTWGISDYVNEAGEYDNRFNMTLNFPTQEYRKPSTDVFLEKMKEFEEATRHTVSPCCSSFWSTFISRISRHFPKRVFRCGFIFFRLWLFNISTVNQSYFPERFQSGAERSQVIPNSEN